MINIDANIEDVKKAANAIRTIDRSTLSESQAAAIDAFDAWTTDALAELADDMLTLANGTPPSCELVHLCISEPNFFPFSK